MGMSKALLTMAGQDLIEEFCQINNMSCPSIEKTHIDDWRFGVCAYYRYHTIHVCPAKCANIGFAARAWSFPGYVIDRTPYGVLAHELGHAIDFGLGKTQDRYHSEFSVGLRAKSGERKLTGYCPNDAEWFAEMFRLFVTNPDLLNHLRPKTYYLIRSHDLKPVENRPWYKVLKEAPERTINQAAKKIEGKSR